MAEKSVLIVIDVQEKYISRYPQELVSRINERLDSAVASGIPVIYVLNAGKDPESEISPLANGLTEVQGAKIIKRSPSSFSSEQFISEIEKYRDRTLEIVGVDGSCCVAKTAMDGAKRGYRVRLVLPCVGSVHDRQYLKKLEEMAAVGVEFFPPWEER